MRTTIAAVALSILGAPALGHACEGDARLTLDKPATLEGVLKNGQGTHEAQGAFSYVYLALDKPVCVDAPVAGAADEDPQENVEAPVDRVQLAGEAVGAELPIGKHVSVSGTLFAAHTMWHVEDVLIDASEVSPR
ncbi:DUF4431 domain-containing protein [Hyphomicrobium sp. 1Nfss2.1]|uniref:DUF4431 domain-containing protein n=1 Tax=Hyphomicrobium sp. 1Nfss2.1 TaxID=3413936 RepID=UPI003C7DDCBE